LRERGTSVLFEELAPGSRMLELGCGAGVPTARALARRFQVTGVDISAAQVVLARRNVPDALFLRADMTEIEFAPDSFHGVVAFWSLIHVPRREQPALLRKVASWLRPGGYFVAIMGARAMRADVDDYMGAQMYWSGFDAQTNVRLLEEAGLRIVSAEEGMVVEDGERIPWLCVIARKPDPLQGQQRHPERTIGDVPGPCP
jgi:cyclopropane fatty-acyl-phospholipid synthase-like methyltransferase